MTPTTRWCVPSGTRGRPTTSRASPSASAWWSPTPTARPRVGRRCSGRPTRHRARSAARPEGTVVLDPETGAECPPARFDDQRPPAQRGGGDRRAGVEGRRRRLRGLLAQRRRRAGPVARGLVLDGRSGLSRRTRVSSISPGATTTGSGSTARTSRRRPIERILQRHPDVVLAAVYAVPDPVVGDQVMAAVQLRPGSTSLDAAEFAAFLAAQG